MGNTPAAPASEIPDGVRSRRKNIVDELLATEKTYLEGLTATRDVYMIPLKTSDLIDPTTHKQLFSNMETLINLHETFVKDLSALITTWDDSTCLGPVFSPLAGLFVSVYSQYANGYGDQLAVLKRLGEDKQWNIFVEKAVAVPICKRRQISDFLITPIQRLPRYVLLLTDLVKSTPDTHPDHQNLAVALSKMRDVATSVNKKQKEMEDRQILLEIDSDVSDKLEPFLRPGRSLLERVEIQHQKPKPKAKVKDSTLLLFNDSIVMCAPQRKISLKSEKLRFKWKASMMGSTVSKCTDQPNCFDFSWADSAPEPAVTPELSSSTITTSRSPEPDAKPPPKTTPVKPDGNPDAKKPKPEARPASKSPDPKPTKNADAKAPKKPEKADKKPDAKALADKKKAEAEAQRKKEEEEKRKREEEKRKREEEEKRRREEEEKRRREEEEKRRRAEEEHRRQEEERKRLEEEKARRAALSSSSATTASLSSSALRSSSASPAITIKSVHEVRFVAASPEAATHLVELIQNAQAEVFRKQQARELAIQKVHAKEEEPNCLLM
ncbi:guanine nucleotide exchange factor [Pelomyxa schiedti]|nr:guanine nucleotide exchange factor [Pelomyxa schiedti]